VPFDICSNQRVDIGSGQGCTIGKLLWTGLINAFPDLSNEVMRIISGNDGQVAAEVMITGTQAQDWVPVHTRGRTFHSPHLFVFHVNDLGKIDNITSYSDNGAVRHQLGAAELD
jgi:predicted ester cyclase